MSRAKIYLRNLTANWIGYGLNLIIMFAMSPFVIHRLGDVNYGVWTIMMSMTGYLGLVEIGTRGALGRFINYYLGKKEIDKLGAARQSVGNEMPPALVRLDEIRVRVVLNIEIDCTDI